MSNAPFMPPERRAKLMAMYMQGLGYSFEDAALVIDLAVLATQKAGESAALVAESAPRPDLVQQVLSMQAQLMAAVCESYIDNMRRTADELGVFTLSTGPI